MTRGHYRWNEPPWWAWVVMVAGPVFLVVAVPLLASRGELSAAEIAAIESRAAEQRAAQTVPTEPPRAAFLGDSYTAGSGIDPAVFEEERWPAVTCAELGCVELNFGSGGTGYTTAGPLEGGTVYSDRFDDIAATDPDVVIVSGGRNDMEAAPEDFEAAVTDDFRRLRGALPDARIVAVQPLWDASPYPAQLAQMGETIRAAVTAVGGAYVPLPNPLNGQSQLISDDEIHPNAEGHRVLGEAIADALRAAGAI